MARVRSHLLADELLRKIPYYASGVLHLWPHRLRIEDQSSMSDRRVIPLQTAQSAQAVEVLVSAF